MFTPLVSVIVPIYKVEPYLRRCLESIVNQSYRNLEIILIDDGSPDKCPQICDEYAAKDNRIKVIHKENGGLSDARNVGLNICKGQYISFVDSDDWIDEHFFENLLSSTTNNEADIVVASCKYVTDNPAYSEKKFSTKKGEIKYEDILQEIFIQRNPSFVAAWGKIFSHKIISQFKFPIGKIHEDEYLNYQWFYKAKKIVYEARSTYFYVLRPDSITGTHSNYNKIDIMHQQYQFFHEKGITQPIQWLLPSLCQESLWEYGNAALMHDTKRIETLHRFRQYVKALINEKNVPRTVKIAFFICAQMPFIYLFYRRFMPFKIRD